MNSHLSGEQLCHWMAGERGKDEEQHLRECPACRVELDQFQNALAGFRGSLEQWPVPAVSRCSADHIRPRWILATAAALLLLATPAYWNVARQRAAERAKADELLLERVEEGLSRAVPASMEPLLQLISKETGNE